MLLVQRADKLYLHGDFIPSKGVAERGVGIQRQSEKKNPTEFDYMKAFIKCFEPGTGTSTVSQCGSQKRARAEDPW